MLARQLYFFRRGREEERRKRSSFAPIASTDGGKVVAPGGWPVMCVGHGCIAWFAAKIRCGCAYPGLARQEEMVRFYP